VEFRQTTELNRCAPVISTAETTVTEGHRKCSRTYQRVFPQRHNRRFGEIDLRKMGLDDLLSAVDGRSVETARESLVLRTAGAEARRFDMNFVERFLDLLVNPDLAYILLVIGIFGIIFELSAPGIGGAGIAGGIAFLLSLVSFGSLPTNFGGILFIVLAVVLFIVDIKAPTHGLLTAGGIAAFLIGSFLLFPPRSRCRRSWSRCSSCS